VAKEQKRSGAEKEETDGILKAAKPTQPAEQPRRSPSQPAKQA
jgi:hypothetical protein